MPLAQESKHAIPIQRVLRVLIAVFSLFLVVLFLITALRRLHYPYELEELEGYMFVSALRVYHGLTVYPRPSTTFIPYMYPPGYYYATAFLGKFIGMTISTMRLTSILSTVGGFAMIYLLVWKEVKQFLAAIAAVGIYAGCYTVCQEWFDFGRLDSFFILLILLAIYATRHFHPVIAAIFWILAFQTKQSILPVAIVLLCYNFKDLRRTVTGVATLLAGVLGSVIYFNHVTGGWYSFYVFQVPKANADILRRAAALFWPLDVLRPLTPVLIVIVAAYLLTQPRWSSRSTRFYTAACCIIPLFWWIRTHGGSTMNALMPIYALFAVLFGISLGRLFVWFASYKGQYAQAGLTLLLLATFAQEAAGLYNPGDFVPPLPVRQSLDHAVADIRAIPGEVMVAQHPYYAYLAGKSTRADIVSITDAMHAATPQVQAELRQDLRNTLEGHAYSAVIVDRLPETDWLAGVLGRQEDWKSLFPYRQNLIGVLVDGKPAWLLAPCPPPANLPCDK